MQVNFSDVSVFSRDEASIYPCVILLLFGLLGANYGRVSALVLSFSFSFFISFYFITFSFSFFVSLFLSYFTPVWHDA